MKKLVFLLLIFFSAIMAAQSPVPVHLSLNSTTGVYGKGEKVEVYASLKISSRLPYQCRKGWDIRFLGRRSTYL